MKQDVKKYGEECLVCQRNKSLALSPAGLLWPPEVLNNIWSDISMDFIEGLPKAAGFEVSLRKRRNEKLSPKFFGPYRIIESIGPVAYNAIDSPTHEWKAVPEEVFGYKKNAFGVLEVLISWKGLPRHEATWEVCDEFQQQFPDFHLEDKVDLERESNVRPPIILQAPSNCLKLIATFKEKGVWAQKIDLILEQPMGYRPSPLGKNILFKQHFQWGGDRLVEILWSPWVLIEPNPSELIEAQMFPKLKRVTMGQVVCLVYI
ncbi:putative integrase [Cucumis melo var. makuwa]|uniref:Putative integrase n=1 Tax=Cucumis melo var. makuwa TaxID=1194695 RepID=A0A5D3CXY3_CUCMM|nr:putative integrase [Cucumis melo var. makuwa]